MQDAVVKQQPGELLKQLRSRIEAPRLLKVSATEQAVLLQAIDRVQVQLLGGPAPVLVVVLAGGTGAGKSTLINALAGAVIAEVGDKRPTTTRLRVYHHRDAAAGGLPVELAEAASFVPHDRPELLTKVLIDTPDLDSFATQHRALTRQVLKAAGLVLYVFSPEKYLEERTWSVLREEQRFSASAAVLNKTDRVSSAELEHITADLRRRFADIGLGSIRIFRTCALAHIPRADGTLPPAPSGVDDTPALRAFLEHELRTSDVMRLRQEQHQRVIAHLQQEIERVAPAALLTRFDEVAALAAQESVTVAERLTRQLAERLAAVDAALVAVATLRQHERFRGPFRTWLVVTDCVRFGLPGLVRRLMSGAAPMPGTLVQDLLSHAPVAAVDDLLRDAILQIQDRLYAHSLPVEPWRALTAMASGTRLVTEIASEIDTRFQTAVATALQRGGGVVWLANALGTLVPAVCVLVGLYVMSRDVLEGRYVGLPLLGHLMAMGTLFFLALQGGVSLFLPATRWRGRDSTQQAVQAALTRTLKPWLEAYRRELEADLADLHEPLAALALRRESA